MHQTEPNYTERENYTVLSPAETARLLGVYKLTLLRMRQRDNCGGLPFVKLSSNRIGYVWHDVQALSPEGALAPAQTTGTIVSFPLTGRPITKHTERSRLNAAACAGLVDVDAIDDASRYYPLGMAYDWWRDSRLFPIATAIAWAPEHTERLRQIFDRENRRTADPAGHDPLQVTAGAATFHPWRQCRCEFGASVDGAKTKLPIFQGLRV